MTKMLGKKHAEISRERIRASMVLTNAIKIAEGKKPNATSTEVTAALGLLKKVIPDMAATHVTLDEKQSFEDWLAELDKEDHAEDDAEETED